MKKVLIICRAFAGDYMTYRWEQMAKDYPDLDITLVGPAELKLSAWGEGSIKKREPIKQDRFQYITLPFVNNKLWLGGYSVKGLANTIKSIKPDLIYLIGTEISDISLQVAYLRKRYLPKAKIALFTMRGIDLPLKNINFRLRWKLLVRSVDAFFCHCPRTVEILRLQGKVWQPIYMQTQVGVPTDIFKPDLGVREEVRKKYKVADDEYLFGTICRLDIRKGLLDILNALPVNAKWKYIIIGSGNDENIIKKTIEKTGLKSNVILTGKLSYPHDVAMAINALDCSVLMSKTLPDNCDTFPLAVAQSMATAKPVIVSTSGGLPYQVGKKGIVVNEGDIEALHSKMEYLANNPNEGINIGEEMHIRLLKSFSVKHLNRCFYFTIKDILNNEYNLEHMDQQNFTF